MTTLYDFNASTLGGEEKSLADYRGQVVLVVNTASNCGFTPQFTGLEALHQEFGARGLAVLGFPSNQFNQELDTADEIAAVCQRNYGVTFQMFEKVQVNGASPPAVEMAAVAEEGPPRREDQVELHQVPRWPRRPGHRAVRALGEAGGHSGGHRGRAGLLIPFWVGVRPHRGSSSRRRTRAGGP